MKYSVSAVCLKQAAFEDNVLALLDYPVTDLHCDYFPELDTAPSLSLTQLDWCLRNWPRGLTIHLWGYTGLRQLPESAERGRLLVQLHGPSDEQLQIISFAAQCNGRTGISVSPEFAHAVVERVTLPLAAVQVLATSTPGFPGGSFLPAAWTALAELSRLRATRQADWRIEVDGGVTESVLTELADRCDLGVIGSNYLREHPTTGRWVPDRLLEGTCSTVSMT